jgi:hypothetical protein
MKKFATLLAVLALVGVAGADNYASLGYSDDGNVIGDQSDQCVGTFYANHDGSFENGYCWQYGGIMPPYYGAFGESYDIEGMNVECAVYTITQVGNYFGQLMDCYVWDGGVYGPPGDVLCVVPGVGDLNIPFWPDCGENEIMLNCCPPGIDFTVGYWADFADTGCGWFCCMDLDGFGGYPWTNIAPGIGFPTGWNHVSVVWGPTQASGTGIMITDPPSPAESQTWGSIKSLFE